MCGLVGFLERGGARAADEAARLMADALHHRGPDGGGVWTDSEAGIALAHRRLSILDLSPSGAQPMTSASGRFVIAFNGEIYNHLELRADLAAVAWRGHSDTETLLAAVEAWGLETALRRSVGMFALALWDRGARVLSLARDRMGEKPLYYGWQSSTLVFGSELKALRRHPAFIDGVDRDALDLFLRYGYIPAPYSIYEGIRKLPPGTWVTARAEDAPGTLRAPKSYWSLSDASRAPAYAGTAEEAAWELEHRLTRSVRGQLLSDVPLGAFLSGGVDSSAIVALMQSQSRLPVKTFTIGFEESGYDEAGHARAVARHLGTEHTELYVTASEARAVIPRLSGIYDEPFGDSSAIPTFLVSQMARRHVTVALSGDGGDELFGGYGRYASEPATWARFRGMPFRNVAAAAAWAGFRALQGGVGDKAVSIANRLRAISASLGARDFGTFYSARLSQWSLREKITSGASGVPGALPEPAGGFAESMMLHDALTFLPDDILCKVDRAAMAVSLESRAPLLDHRVVEFAASLPLGLKIRDGRGKWLLREVLYRHVPRELIERPKMGFAIPIAEWLRGPLREWGEALLAEDRIRREGYLNAKAVRLRWEQHQRGRGDWQHSLWSVLMFQEWLEARDA